MGNLDADQAWKDNSFHVFANYIVQAHGAEGRSH
jgi:hypothetical protein